MYLVSIKEIDMQWIKITVLSVVVPYLTWSLYSDFRVKQSGYLGGEIKRLKEFGETYKKKVGKYAFRDCHFYRTYTLKKQMEGAGCVQSMIVNSVTYDTSTSSPRVIYRGKSSDGKYMCELDLGIVFEGRDAGDIDCDMTRFKSSEAYKISVGGASAYASKIKDIKREAYHKKTKNSRRDNTCCSLVGIGYRER